MNVCTKCLYHSCHPLTITFDARGVCSGCLVHNEKDELDWHDRGGLLRRILNEYKSSSGKNYDCIVPVSGARDSWFIVHTVKNTYGMNPLLVTYNKHFSTSVGVRNLAQLRIRFNCDIMTMTVNPETVKTITRATIRRLGSTYWHCIAGQTVFPVQLATRLKIPLIIWGAHQGIDQVGMFSHLDEVEMTRRYRKNHDLMGLEADDLVDDFDGIREADIEPYCYPDDIDIEQVGVRGIYLNNYIRWDSRDQHQRMIELFGYETLTQTRTYDCCNDSDCWVYSDLHDFTKLLKHGYSKVVDHVIRDLRLGYLTREQAILLCRKYIFQKPKHMLWFLDWIGITENAFWYLIDQHRNKEIWQRDENFNWRIKPNSYTESLFGDDVSGVYEKLKSEKDFPCSARFSSSDCDDKYILIGKGCN